MVTLIRVNMASRHIAPARPLRICRPDKLQSQDRIDHPRRHERLAIGSDLKIRDAREPFLQEDSKFAARENSAWTDMRPVTENSHDRLWAVEIDIEWIGI